MKIIAIGGEPATGKSELVKKIRESFDLKKFKYKKILDYEKTKNGIIIFGKYEGGKFDGTDRLAMSVQPVAVDFLEKKSNLISVLIFEGDRLFNDKFLSYLNKYEVAKIILECSEKSKKLRHENRSDTQGEQFLKSRKTKISNIIKKHKCILLKNDLKKDLISNAGIIFDLIKSKDFQCEIKKLFSLNPKNRNSIQSFFESKY